VSQKSHSLDHLERRHKLPLIGWREYISLPDLGIDQIKAKIDTGARSSALHAFDVHFFEKNGIDMVRFKVHPYQRDSDRTVVAEAELLDHRQVKSSIGHAQVRPTIKTIVGVGNQRWEIELTLTNRDVMGFRMLLGRQAIRNRFLVDVGKSFLNEQA
jgi:hypothetical protein